MTLGNNIRLNIPIVIFASPDESTIRFQHLSNHVINKSVLIPSSKSIKVFFVVCFKDVLENVLKSSIISLHDCVFSTHVQRPFLFDSHLHGTMGEISDGLISVVHGHGNTTTSDVIMDMHINWFSS